MSFAANKDLPTNRVDYVFLRVSDLIKEHSVPILYLAILLGLIISVVGKYLPKVGHDYGFFLPRMLDTHLHHRINGLSIQWYTANFGAGTPAYPNPQYIQYSLPQFLMFLVNPWTSLMLSLIVYAVIGYLCFYLFLRYEMGWIRNASALGASFILANGFFVDHAIVGHVGFQGFPLLGAIFFLLFSKKINSLLAGVLIGILVAVIMNQAGFIILVIFALSLCISLPIIYLLRAELFKPRLCSTLATGVFSAAFLSISKVSAVIAFMRFFPRIIEDQYKQTYLQGILGMMKQLTGFSFVVPYHLFTDGKIANITSFFQKGAGEQFGIWETNISVSPGLLLLLALGIAYAVLKVRQTKLGVSKDQWIAILVLCLAIWLVTDLALAQGLLYRLIKPLPVIRSLHADLRFTSALIFPLSLLGACVFHEVFKSKKLAGQAMFAVASLGTIAMVCLYFVVPQDVYNRSFNIKLVLSTYPRVDQGKNFTLTNVAKTTDMDVFQTGNSNLASQDPMFGYVGEYFKPQVVPGPIMEIRNGHYNLTNPAGYVFPEENNLQPFEPFRVDEKADLELFINHKQPNLKISNWQKTADISNFTALIAAFLYLLFESTKEGVRLWAIAKFTVRNNQGV